MKVTCFTSPKFDDTVFEYLESLFIILNMEFIALMYWYSFLVYLELYNFRY